MTPRSIRRAQERKARKEADRKAKNIALRVEELLDIPNGATESGPLADTPDFTPGLNPPAVSESKLKANRANAQFSTGPTSEEGRAKASLNAVKTGLTGRTILLPSDDAAEYERHIQAFAEQYSPVGAREADLVQSIADTFWRLKRIPCLESALFAQGRLEFAGCFEEHDASARPSLIDAKTFIKYQRQLRNLQLQEARLFRRYEKDKAELREIQQTRRSQEGEALDQAAAQYQAAKRSSQAFHPADFGFEFSIAQIEQHLQRIQARETRLAAAKTAASYSKTVAQAA